MISDFDLPKALEEHGALLHGHFRLSSGRHSPQFVQKFRLLEHPELVERVARDLITHLGPAILPNVVISAAVGAIVLGYEVARQLNVRAIFVEKEAGLPALRRGFLLEPGDRVLVVEDVVTTGKSVREVLDVVRFYGATPVALGIVVQREPVDFGIPTVALLELPIASFEPATCPQCKMGEPIIEPGSRNLR